MGNRAAPPFAALAGCAQRLAIVTSSGGRGLLPWVCVLALSAAMAHAADQALTATLVEQPPAPHAELARDEARHTGAFTPPGFHWIAISSVDAQGTPSSLKCLTTLEYSSADILEVSAEELDLLVSELCSDSSR